MSDIFQPKHPQIDEFEVLVLRNPEQLSAYSEKLKSLITRSLSGFEEYGGVIDAVYRRLENFEKIYSSDGSAVFVMLDPNKSIIGTAGIGSLAGLPVSEGMGEIRDLVISTPYRGRGLGAKLLREALNTATGLGYSRIYLETTPQMLSAQKLFKSFGFSPLPSQKSNSKNIPDFVRTKTKQQSKSKTIEENYPAYFVLDDLIQPHEST